MSEAARMRLCRGGKTRAYRVHHRAVMSARSLVLVFPVTLAFSAAATAQQTTREQIRDSQLRLEQIRAERERLQGEIAGLQTRVRDASRQLTRVERLRNTSASALRELEHQTNVVSNSVKTTTAQRTVTMANL